MLTLAPTSLVTLSHPNIHNTEPTSHNNFEREAVNTEPVYHDNQDLDAVNTEADIWLVLAEEAMLGERRATEPKPEAEEEDIWLLLAKATIDVKQDTVNTGPENIDNLEAVNTEPGSSLLVAEEAMADAKQDTVNTGPDNLNSLNAVNTEPGSSLIKAEEAEANDVEEEPEPEADTKRAAVNTEPTGNIHDLDAVYTEPDVGILVAEEAEANGGRATEPEQEPDNDPQRARQLVEEMKQIIRNFQLADWEDCCQKKVLYCQFQKSVLDRLARSWREAPKWWSLTPEERERGLPPGWRELPTTFLGYSRRGAVPRRYR
ncbi:MAG: hypothetical protein Q9187_002828, partial [Circinaria calcarea]